MIPGGQIATVAAAVIGDAQIEMHFPLFGRNGGRFDIARFAGIDQIVPVFVLPQGLQEPVAAVIVLVPWTSTTRS